MNHQIDELKERIAQSEQAREQLKKVDLKNANDHVIQLEEELYQAKQVQIDMLESMKKLEDELEH